MAPALAPLFRPRNEIPTPLTPEPLSFAPKDEGAVRLSTWNVRSLRDCNSPAKQHALRRYIEAEDPDILVITEGGHPSPSTDQALDWLRPRFPHRYWRSACSILSKIKPISVAYGCPDATRSSAAVRGGAEQRCIILEFPSTFVVGTYVPNAGAGGKCRERREGWNEAFAAQLRAMHAKGKGIIWAGDFNVIPSRLDLEIPNINWDLLPGCYEWERAFHAELLDSDLQLVDLWRRLHPAGKAPKGREYSHWSKKFGGWRLDGFICSVSLVDRVISNEIRHAVHDCFPGSSDHWPVAMDLKGAL